MIFNTIYHLQYAERAVLVHSISSAESSNDDGWWGELWGSFLRERGEPRGRSLIPADRPYFIWRLCHHDNHRSKQLASGSHSVRYSGKIRMFHHQVEINDGNITFVFFCRGWKKMQSLREFRGKFLRFLSWNLLFFPVESSHFSQVGLVTSFARAYWLFALQNSQMVMIWLRLTLKSKHNILHTYLLQC